MQHLLKTEPKYQILARHLREQIANGELKPGDRLPSYPEMRAQGVSQMVLDKVYGLLENEGLIVREAKRGIFVAEPGRRTATRILGCIGLRADSEQHPYSARVLSGAQDEAHEAGYDLLLFQDNLEARWELLDGLLVFSYGGMQIAKARPPIVPCVGVLVYVSEFSCVAVDDEKALYDLTSHLLSIGHRRIAYMANDPTNSQSLRLRGYYGALRAAGVEVNPRWVRSWINEPVFDKNIGFTGYGYRTMQDWLSSDWKEMGCTALLCQNDEVAVGALQALKESGLRVPDDVSVAGFDGTEISAHTQPPLTTIEAPLYETGRRSIKRLLQLLSGEAQEPPTIELLPARLLVRGTTANYQGV